ncbi:MAG: sulfite exporter TauE/SafE family protein [Candidatus Omnitrophica bacterium]|nr:sulfite exporter TauE/SafE family protein [Candidatus Omnitrophota bacterium]
MSDNLQIFSAFGAGLLTFFSPCVLPLIPVYICFITGLSLQELTDTQEKVQAKKKIILTEAILFILGFSLVFVALGATAGYIGSFFMANKKILRLIGAAVLILFGLYLTGLFKLRLLEQEKRIHLKAKPVSWLGSFFVGMAFGLGWTPCVGPILGGILVMAATKETLLEGMFLLSAYSLGLAIPLLLVSIGVKRAMDIFTKVKMHFKIIKLTSGILLIAIGIGIMLT